MLNMGSWEGAGCTRVVPLPAHPYPIPRVHPSPHHGSLLHARCGHGSQDNMVVGLRSVDQLSLVRHFSGFRGITEVYNVAGAGITNNH